MKRLIGPGVLIGIGVALGMPLGMSIVPFLLRSMSDAWIGFSGSIAGGVVAGVITVVAAAIAAAPVFRQLELSERQTALSVRGALENVAKGVGEELRWLYSERHLTARIETACRSAISEKEFERIHAKEATDATLQDLDKFRLRVRDYCNVNPGDGRIAKQRRVIRAGTAKIAKELLALQNATGALDTWQNAPGARSSAVEAANRVISTNKAYKSKLRAFRVMLNFERRLLWREIRKLERLAIGNQAGLGTYNDNEP